MLWTSVRVQHRATSQLNSSISHARSVTYVSDNVEIFSVVIFLTTRWNRYSAKVRFSDNTRRDSTLQFPYHIIWSMNAKNNETFQYCFGVFAGWLALVVCRPHRLGIFSTISKGSDNSNADWYISFQTDEPYTVKCAPKTTCLRLSITNSNLVKDTSYCPILSESPITLLFWNQMPLFNDISSI